MIGVTVPWSAGVCKPGVDSREWTAGQGALRPAPTVRKADSIAVLDRGRLVEQGSHEELLTAGGLYARLVGRQLAAASGGRAAE